MYTLCLFQELCPNPQLFSSAPSQSGVKAGKKSSSWVVSAISVLGGMRELFYMVRLSTQIYSLKIIVINVSDSF